MPGTQYTIFPSVGILQSYRIHRILTHLFFQPVFWGRGLLHCFSGNPACAEMLHSLSGGWAQWKPVFCMPFVPWCFPCLFRGSEQKWPQPNLWPRAEKSQSALFNRPSRTVSTSACVAENCSLLWCMPTPTLSEVVSEAQECHCPL